ncbi:MAG: hypothetical protein ACK5TE_10140 [Pseudomonadota bacterium]
MNTATVGCPYCAADLAPGVMACRHCGRMVGQLLPLLVRQRELAAEITELRAELACLRGSPVPPSTGMQHATGAGSQPLPRAPSAHHAPAATLAAAVLLVTTASALLHWLLLFVYDAPPLLLRLLTLVVPFALGLRANWVTSGRAATAAYAIAAIACGASSVLAMLAITHLIDDVPLLPQDARELREALEYAASIALAFLAGLLVVRAIRRVPRPAPAPGALVGYAQRFQQAASLLSPICAGGLALYSGLKSLVGD